jgi:hypothetical protein
MANAHHLGDPTGIVFVGFYWPSGQETLRVTGLDADCLEAGSNEMPVQPFRKWTGLQANYVNLIVPKPKLVDQRPWFAVYLSLPNKLTVMVEHTDSRFLQRDVEANNLAHGSLRSNGGRLRA